MAIIRWGGLALIAGWILMSGCASTPQRAELLRELEVRGVSPVLHGKMSAGERLQLEEIEELAAKQVNDSTVIDYIRSTGAIYLLRVDQIERLRTAGVSETVINYLLATRQTPPSQTYFFYDPFYDFRIQPYPYYYGPRYYYPRYYSPRYYSPRPMPSRPMRPPGIPRPPLPNPNRPPAP